MKLHFLMQMKMLAACIAAITDARGGQQPVGLSLSPAQAGRPAETQLPTTTGIEPGSINYQYEITAQLITSDSE